MLAIKLYGKMPVDCKEVLLGISPKIPANVVDLDKNPEYANDTDYLQMTKKAYNEYNESLKTEYAEWKVIQENIVVEEVVDEPEEQI